MKDLRRWIPHVEEVRPQMDTLAQSLCEFGANVEPQNDGTLNRLPYYATFRFDSAVVTIGFLLKDWDTDSEVVIDTMTTLPATECSKGYGSRAVRLLLQWATARNFNEVRATQIGNRDSERFWERNGFRRCPPPNPCNDFVYPIARKP